MNKTTNERLEALLPKLRNICSGYRINADDAAWLEGLLHTSASLPEPGEAFRVEEGQDGYWQITVEGKPYNFRNPRGFKLVPVSEPGVVSEAAVEAALNGFFQEGPVAPRTEYAKESMRIALYDALSHLTPPTAPDEELDELAASNKLRLACADKLGNMVNWLEKNQPDVFSRGIWEAVDRIPPTAPESIEASSNSEYLRELAELLRSRGLHNAALPLPAIAAYLDSLTTAPEAACTCPHQDANEPQSNHASTCPAKEADNNWIKHPQTIEAKRQWDEVALALGVDGDDVDAVLIAARARASLPEPGAAPAAQGGTGQAESFEAWARPRFSGSEVFDKIHGRPGGWEYNGDAVQAAWSAWQAATAKGVA